jgi:hypothetical protein
MLRVTFIVLQLCLSAQALTSDCNNGCVSGDDANTLLQAKMHATDEGQKQSLASVAGPLIQEIKGIALVGSRGRNTLMTKTLRDITSLASGLITMGGARNLTLVQTISDMLETTLVPGLMLAVSSAQGELNKSHQDIVTCNDVATSTEQAINGDEKVAKDSSQTDHEGCRTAEAAKLAVAEEKFARLESFRAKLDPPAEVDDPVPEQIAYYESARDFFNTQTPILISLHGDSTAANESFAAQHEQCDSDQSEFETSFCVYRTALKFATQTASTCYKEKKAAFETEAGAKQTLEEDFVQEYIAMKKILCYLRVWLETDDVTQIDKTITSICDAKNIVAKPVELVYPEIPDAYLINMEPVAIYPGEAAFETQYYTEETLSYHDVTPCETTTATTEQAVTTCPGRDMYAYGMSFEYPAANAGESSKAICHSSSECGGHGSLYMRCCPALGYPDGWYKDLTKGNPWCSGKECPACPEPGSPPPAGWSNLYKLGWKKPVSWHAILGSIDGTDPRLLCTKMGQTGHRPYETCMQACEDSHNEPRPSWMDSYSVPAGKKCTAIRYHSQYCFPYYCEDPVFLKNQVRDSPDAYDAGLFGYMYEGGSDTIQIYIPPTP